LGEITVDALIASVRQIFHDDHEEMRRIVIGRDADVLNWHPGSDTNSITALVAHSLDAERHLLATLVGIEMERDRDAQFELRVSGPDELLALVDPIEREVDGYLDRLDGARLTSSITRRGRTHEGSWWLLHVIEHSREHIGQATLTLQLYEQSRRDSA
jgi:uncharacterized damage-inducible protein DinB